MYELKGLSEEESWELFKEISLGQREDKVVTSLLEIGKDIVRKCANVPLSLRVIASLLRNQDIATWQSLKSIDLANMYDGADGVDGIIPTLMFSYYHLAPELKCCFSFCSVFPEDYRIEKEMLISLWMAQGYLVPSSKTENMEDVGERYFSVLLQRCFFQDVLHNVYGGVESVKMHDLIHDLARKVAGKETLTSSASRSHEVEGKVRHMFIDDINNEHLTNWLSSSNSPSKTLRTFLNINDNILMCISKCSRLRALDLHGCFFIRNIPDTLGKLLHLRYLDLSDNTFLEMLPQSITNLYNLETLKLCRCRSLEELPKDTNRLVNLRVLDIRSCKRLTYMPAEMGKLTYLNTLPMFIVVRDDDELKQDKKGRLIDLKALINNLRGTLDVIPLDCMQSRGHTVVLLESLQLKCRYVALNVEFHESVLECLFSNHQFSTLSMVDYDGTKSLKSIERLELCNCWGVENLGMEQFTNLKSLSLSSMNLKDTPWKSLHSLSSFGILFLPRVDNTAKGDSVLNVPSIPHS